MDKLSSYIWSCSEDEDSNIYSFCINVHSSYIHSLFKSFKINDLRCRTFYKL